MNTEKIFDYSENFLNESIEELKKLQIIKLSSPKNKDFDNKLKIILGKNISDTELEKYISLKDKDLKEELYKKFNDIRQNRINLLGEDQAKNIEKKIFLQTIDLNWKSHIQYLEQLRQVIGLRSYGQRDPLIEYKKEAFDLFENLLSKLKFDFITILFNLKIINQSEESDDKREIKKKIANNPKCLLILKKDQKISRNDRCQVTGKKFKNCCGAL